MRYTSQFRQIDNKQLTTNNQQLTTVSVIHELRILKARVIYRGWIGGYTNSKTKAVSIYDINWKRIGQFSPNKTKLLRRSNKLCVA